MVESKSRLLYILKYLWQNTDAKHYATTADILALLKGNGTSCDRKMIPSDIQKLCDMGMDIEEEHSRENRYSLSSHLFTLPELKLLIDEVESSKFITSKKSEALIEKIHTMTSPTFFGWAFGFSGKVQILAPESVKEQYRQMITKADEDMQQKENKEQEI